MRRRARACARACLSKTDGGAWLCLCVGNESISFTLVSLPGRAGRVGAASCNVACSLPLFFSHMLVPFCLYCSLSHLSHSLPATVFASEPSSSIPCLYLPVIAWAYLAALNIFIFYCSVYLVSIQSPTVSPFLHLFTIDPSGLFHYVAFKNHPKKGDRNRSLSAVARFLACCYFKSSQKVTKVQMLLPSVTTQAVLQLNFNTGASTYVYSDVV